MINFSQILQDLENKINKSNFVFITIGVAFSKIRNIAKLVLGSLEIHIVFKVSNSFYRISNSFFL